METEISSFSGYKTSCFCITDCNSCTNPEQPCQCGLLATDCLHPARSEFQRQKNGSGDWTHLVIDLTCKSSKFRENVKHRILSQIWNLINLRYLLISSIISDTYLSQVCCSPFDQKLCFKWEAHKHKNPYFKIWTVSTSVPFGPW